MKISLLLLTLGVATHGEVPVDFDCGMRQLASDMASRWQPYRDRATLQEVVDDLNLPGGLPGGETLCFNATLKGTHPEQFAPVFNSVGATCFVDQAVGSLFQKGTFDEPFPQLIQCVQASRERLDGSLFTIVIRKGTYYLNDTITLGSKDSNLVFQNYNGEEVWLSGAKDIKGSWTKHPFKKSVWTIHVPDMQDVSGLRIGGHISVRARYPNGCSSDDPLPSGYKCMGKMQGKRVVNPEDGFGTNLQSTWILPELPTLNQSHWRQVDAVTPARSSYVSQYRHFQMGIGGSCAHFDPPAGYWCGVRCWGGAGTPPDCIYRIPQGVSIAGVLPVYKDLSRAVVQVWRPGHWSSWMFEVSASRSNSTHLIFSRGGFQGGRGENYGEAFFIENVEEELDAENEFFYDPTTQLLQYVSAEEPDSKVEVLKLKTLFELQGDQSSPVTNIHFLGLGFRDTHHVYMDNHTMPSGGDWGLSLKAVIQGRGVSGLVINSTRFYQIDGNAILIKGFARDVTIENNHFKKLGGNGIALLGETEMEGVPSSFGFGWNGTAGNQPSGVIVRGNVGQQCAMVAKQTAFFFQAKSMGTLIERNIFFHAPRAAINFNDGFGGGNIIRHNLLFNTVMETGDHAPFNSWDRQPYAHRKEGNEYIMEKSPDELYANFIIGNYYTQNNIDNDDGSAYFHTHHNLLVYGDHGLKSDFQGHDNFQHHNIHAFLNAEAMTSGDPKEKLAGHQDKFHHNFVLQKHSHSYVDQGSCSCPAPGCTEIHDNSIFTPDGKIDAMCNRTVEEREKTGVDVGTTVASFPPSSSVIDMARRFLVEPEFESTISQII